MNASLTNFRTRNGCIQLADLVSVLNDNRKPIGYLNVPALKSKFESGKAGDADPICKCWTFRSTQHGERA